MEQKKLSEFKDFKVTTPIRSATSNRLYNVDITPGHEHCDCEFFKYHGGKNKQCRHILEAKLETLKKERWFFRNRSPSESNAFFNTFDSFIAHLEYNNDSEFNYYQILILSTLRACHQICNDDIFEMLNGEFEGENGQSGKCKLNSAWGSLQKKGLIRSIQRISSRRITSHAKQSIWELTDEGRELCNEFC